MLYFLYPQLRKLSGAERLILRLATYTAQLGAPVTLVTHYFDPRCAPALGAAVPVIETGIRLNPTRNHYLNAPFEYLYSLRLLNRIGADAEAVTFFGPPSLPALAWASLRRTLRAPLLYFCYEPPRFVYDDTAAVAARLGAAGLLARPLFWLYKWIDRAMVRRADALMANGTFGAERLRAAYGREATVITHGADFKPPALSAVQAIRARYELDGKFVLLSVNFLHPRKRLDLFLKTFALVRAQQPSSVALVVGSGPEAHALRALAQQLGMTDAVIFTGFVPDDQLPAYHAASDVYLSTCRQESFGLSVLEASAAGLAVVSVDEGGPREIVCDGETGFLTPADPRALSAAVLALAHDPALRARMGEAARQRAARYSWARGAHEFLNVVESATANSAPAGRAPNSPRLHSVRQG